MAVVVLVQVSLATETAWAQAGALGSIMGKAADETGGVLPGATVTATSPALQVRNVTTVTDAEGNYRLRDVPAPGTYRVVFELTGFQSIAFDGVNVPAGFTARIDAAMKVSTVSETVEVSGQSPVVDTESVAGVSSIAMERIESVPLGSGIQNLLPLAAGVSLVGVPDVGDSQMASRQRTITYGVTLTPTLEFEGINSTTARQGNTALYLNSFQVEEASFKTTGNNADVAFGGVHQQMIMKSGADTFHGSPQGSYENNNFQGNNITPELSAQGITFTNPIILLRLECGFRRLRCQEQTVVLWRRELAEDFTVPDRFRGGPQCPRVLDVPGRAARRIHKSSGPAICQGPVADFSSNRLIGTFVRAEKKSPFFGASATTPAPTTRVQSQPTRTWKLGSQNTLNNNMLFDSIVGFCCYWTHYFPQPGTAVAGNPASQEITTGMMTGPLGAIPGTVSERYQARSTISYVAGEHQLKAGVDLNWERQDSTRPNEYPSGSYTLLFNRGVPNELRTYNTPTDPIDRMNSQAAFVTDTWSLGRVTLSYGVRWERYHNFIPEQAKAAGQFSIAQTFQALDVLTWSGVVPRVGMNWDVTGDGKTSLKTFFGVFGDTMGADFAATYNPNAEVTTRYRWSGPCVVTAHTNVSFNMPNTSCDYLPGSVDLSTAPGARDYISATGGSNSLLNPDLKQNKNYETSVRIDRQLVPNVAVGFGYIYNRHVNWYGSVAGSNTVDGVNVGRPYAVWNVPVVLTDPFDGQQVTVYTYPADYRGAAFNQNQRLNAPSDRPDYYHSFEVTLNKRFSRRWNMSTSFWVTKTHEWVSANPGNANDDRFPDRDYSTWEARADGTYEFPWDIRVNGTLRAASGALGQRTQTFSDTRLNQGTVTLRMEPYGAQEGPVVPITSLRVGRGSESARDTLWTRISRCST